MIIECPRCETTIHGDVVGELSQYIEEIGETYKLVLIKCPICELGVLGESNLVQVADDKWDWTNPIRRWPHEEGAISHEIPPDARYSLEEASRCFRARAYSTCAVMCGRSIEALCKYHDRRVSNLGRGLKMLRDKEVIDAKIFAWGEELRRQRNLGAHASDEVVSREDARDLLQFATAICEYVFVLNAKFDRFMKRRSK